MVPDMVPGERVRVRAVILDFEFRIWNLFGISDFEFEISFRGRGEGTLLPAPCSPLPAPRSLRADTSSL